MCIVDESIVVRGGGETSSCIFMCIVNESRVVRGGGTSSCIFTIMPPMFHVAPTNLFISAIVTHVRVF